MQTVSEAVEGLRWSAFRLQIAAAKYEAWRERQNRGARWKAVKRLYRLHFQVW